MKAFALFLLTLALGPSAYAKDLKLIVLKQADINSSSIVELSRDLSYWETSDNDNKPVTKWIDVTGGKRCVVVGPKAFNPDNCGITANVNFAMRINNSYDLNFTLYVQASREANRNKAKKPNDFISSDDIEKLRATDVTGAKDLEDDLDLLFDVNNGTVFFDHGEYYRKQIRIYFDQSTRKVDSWQVTITGVPPGQ